MIALLSARLQKFIQSFWAVGRNGALHDRARATRVLALLEFLLVVGVHGSPPWPCAPTCQRVRWLRTDCVCVWCTLELGENRDFFMPCHCKESLPVFEGCDCENRWKSAGAALLRRVAIQLTLLSLVRHCAKNAALRSAARNAALRYVNHVAESLTSSSSARTMPVRPRRCLPSHGYDKATPSVILFCTYAYSGPCPDLQVLIKRRFFLPWA